MTFDLNGADGAAPAERQVAEGAAIGTLPTPSREGYEFLGWHRGKESSSEEVTASTVVTNDLIVYAVWKVAEYTVTFDMNGADGAVPTEREIAYGETIGALPTVARTGYTFLGWFTAASGGTQVDASTTVTSDATYYAHWEVITYTVTFDANGGNGGETRTYQYGGALGDRALPVSSRTGYTFLGWFTAKTGGTQVMASTTVNANANYYAQWRINSYTVTFDANGGTGGETRTYQHGGALGDRALPVSSRTGYTFLGWFTAASGGAQVTADTTVTADATYYAQWERISYTVTFDANGGTGGEAYNYYHGDSLGSMPTPRRDGYVFLGWFVAKVGGTEVTASTMVTSNVIYYAQWESLSARLADALGAGVRSFTSGGGSCWDRQDYGGHDGGSAVRSGPVGDYGSSWMETTVEGPIVVSFRWKVSSESWGDCLRWYVDDVEQANVSGEQDWVLQTAILPEGTHTVRWEYSKNGSRSYGSDCGWVDDFRLLTPYTVTFDANGADGVAPTERQVVEGAELGTLPTPSRTGYTFLGWFTAKTGGTQVTASTTVNANAIYYAQWQINSYTVTFDANGGTGGETRTYQHGGALGDRALVYS